MERLLIPNFILVVLYLIIVKLVCYGHAHIDDYIQSEQDALVDFKSGIKDPHNRLSSWKGASYCSWLGVTCENDTKFVISIDLHNPCARENVYGNWNSMNLSGEIRPSLGKLKHLKYLDLGYNSFQAMPIPQFIKSLHNLLYLNLSTAGFSGKVPSNLGNLSNLQYLDLSTNEVPYLGYFNSLYIEDIGWLRSLPSLKHLSLDLVDLASVGAQWDKVLNRLSNLTELHLSRCYLNGSFPFGLGELPNLQYLDLSWNYHLHGNISQLLSKSWRKLEFLDLRGNRLYGSIPSTIGNYCNLKYLDLSVNNFNGNLPAYIEGNETCGGKTALPNLMELHLRWNQLIGKLPDWLGEVKNLRALDLSSNRLEGSIPSTIGKFCSLKYLDLSSNRINGSLPASIEGDENCGGKSGLPNLMELRLANNQLVGKLPDWLGEVRNLTTLDLSFNQLEGLIPDSLWTLQHLEYLNLGQNKLNGLIPSAIGNFCNLKYLYLSFNNFNGSLPAYIEGQETCSGKSGLLNLLELLLGGNQLIGKLPDWLGELRNLRALDLSYNRLEGLIPDSLSSLQHLESLYLQLNELNGSLPESIGQLSQLNVLDVSSNHFSGIISEEHFWNLSKLEYLYMGDNSFHLNVGPSWIPPFQVHYLHMDSCHLGPSFPTWLQSQNKLQYLYLPNANILSPFPNWFWNFSFYLEGIRLSHNQIYGQLPNWLNFSHAEFVDLSYNLLEGPIPFSIKGVHDLYLSHNKFSGPLPSSMGEYMLNLVSLDLSSNQLTGSIPDSIAHLNFLRVLQLSRNNLTGSIPDSIGHLTFLKVIDFSMNNLIGRIPFILNNCSVLSILDLGNNKFYGEIPKSLGHLQLLVSLHLNHNMLSGQLPSSFNNLSSLQVLDASYNKLSGEVPAWIGYAFPNLVILNLRSNLFSGRLPSQISNLSSLHVLDIAQNNLMGEIPDTLGELKAMAQDCMSIYQLHKNMSTLYYEERLVMFSKGRSLEYTRTLSLVIAIDLSNNNLSGRFPQGITKLFGLVFLNLSRNLITGEIPENISILHQLSSLDLSSNELSGTIPSSMAALTFLSYLNLSYNKFSGKIPFTGQMASFNELAFVGNLDLCGCPLARKCQDEDPSRRQPDVNNKKDDSYVDKWFYLTIGLGFVMGIFIPSFVLVIKKSWCEAYFDFVDGMVKFLLRGRAVYTKNHPRRRN